MHAHRRWALALASIASLMTALDTLVVSMALTTIREDLGASLEELEWTVNAYNLSLAVLLLPAAALGDRFGRRRMFAGGLALFTVSSAACALAAGAGTLIAARAVQGAGAALILSLALAIVSAAYPAERRGGAIGILEGITGLAVVAGPVVGGAVADGLAWEWIFWLNVPIGAVVLPLALMRIEETTGDDVALDLRGVVLIAGAALGVVWALVRGNAAGWGSAEVLVTLAGGAGLLVAFVAWQRRAPEPMLPMHLFASRAFSGGNAATFALFGSIFVGVFFLAQYFQTALGLSPLEAGLRLLPWTALLFVVGPIAGALSDRVGERPLLVAGLAIQGAGYLWLSTVLAPGVAYSEMVLPLVVTGLGGSIAIPPSASAVLRPVPDGLVGKAAGANGLLRELGGVFGIAAGAAVFAGAGSYASPAAFGDGVAAALAASGALALAGMLAAVAIPGRVKAPRSRRVEEPA